jgi:RNA polymerase sigma-70 factor (ECF subfamily)
LADKAFEAVNAGLAALLEAERGALLRFLAARCGDAAEAEDLLQELWLKIAARPSGPVANARGYLFRMANNLVLDRARGRRRAMRRDREWADQEEPAQASIELRSDPAPDAEAGLIEAQESAMVRQAVEALPPGARRALLLYRFEGRGQDEIAGIMGISRSGVEKHLALAMKHLRRALIDCGFLGAAASSEQERAGGAASNGNAKP